MMSPLSPVGKATKNNTQKRTIFDKENVNPDGAPQTAQKTSRYFGVFFKLFLARGTIPVARVQRGRVALAEIPTATTATATIAPPTPTTTTTTPSNANNTTTLLLLLLL
jgi:hypothetical protein